MDAAKTVIATFDSIVAPTLFFTSTASFSTTFSVTYPSFLAVRGAGPATSIDAGGGSTYLREVQ
jgi:hypothetical protein